MHIENSQLIENLLSRTVAVSNRVADLKAAGYNRLNQKAGPISWSVLECIEHLNLYGDYYLPILDEQIAKQQPSRTAQHFKSGMIGDYFVKLMQPKNGTIKKMQAPKDKNPNNSVLSITAIDRFLVQQDRLKLLLGKGEKIDLVKMKVPISLTKFIRLRAGDTFRFLVAHIERHVTQAERALQKAV